MNHGAEILVPALFPLILKKCGKLFFCFYYCYIVKISLLYRDVCKGLYSKSLFSSAISPTKQEQFPRGNWGYRTLQFTCTVQKENVDNQILTPSLSLLGIK